MRTLSSCVAPKNQLLVPTINMYAVQIMSNGSLRKKCKKTSTNKKKDFRAFAEN